MKAVMNILRWWVDFFAVGFAPKTPSGRRGRVSHLLEDGWSEDRAWGVVLTRDIERGAKNFTEEEKAMAQDILKRGVPLA